MNIEDFKKAIYKTKPTATMLYVKANGIHYRAWLESEKFIGHIFFQVPLNDLGDAEWLTTMPSQLLIRYFFFD